MLHVTINLTNKTSSIKKGKDKMKTESQKRIEAVLNDLSTSYWLKAVLRTALERDTCDVLSDLEVLTEVMQARFNDSLKGVEL
jgi:hypothetical protein